MDKYGDAKLFELRHLLDNCPKAKPPASATSAKPGTVKDSQF
jgi:hypothetical protein